MIDKTFLFQPLQPATAGVAWKDVSVFYGHLGRLLGVGVGKYLVSIIVVCVTSTVILMTTVFISGKWEKPVVPIVLMSLPVSLMVTTLSRPNHIVPLIHVKLL